MSVVRPKRVQVANLELMSNDAAHRSGRGRSMKFVDEIAKARASGKPPLFLDETFDAEAKPLPVEGSAVIGHVTLPGVLDALEQAQQRLARSRAGDCFAWLPKESFHVTWLRLLDRRSELDLASLADWQGDLRGRAADFAMMERLRGFDLATRAPYHVKLDEFWRYDDAAGFWVVGATPDEEARIQEMRDAIEAAAGLAHRPRGIEYRLHITLGYLIAWPDEEAAKDMEEAIDQAENEMRSSCPVIEFGSPEVCLFDVLTEFQTQFRLGN